MSDVVMYHPVTEAIVAVPDLSVPHHRRAGWLLLSEHQDNQAAAAQAEAATSQTTAKEK